jgi:CheY-like chemotaxis protein
MANNRPISVLLLDDNPDMVRYYSNRLRRYAGLHLTSETNSLHARNLARRQLFDLVVIDAKLEYRGFEFGGLRLADDLRSRYGANSIIIISRFITSSFASVSELSCEFMEKGNIGNRFERDLCAKLRQMQRQQYAFVAMPFNKKASPLYKSIKDGIIAAGLKCVRIDKIRHTRPIQEVIFEYVEKSKVVVFVADDGNPNAYYEAGFADAMRKEVIPVARSVDDLPFDIRNRNTIAYGSSPSTLAAKIKFTIDALRFRKPLVL